MKMKERNDWKEAKSNMAKMKRSSSKLSKFGLITTAVGLVTTWYAGWKLGVGQTGNGILDTIADDEYKEDKKSEDPIETTGETVNEERES